MSTQTQEPQETTTTLPVTFQGTGHLRLVRVPVRKIVVNMQHTMSEGLDYQFQADGSGGKLVVDEELIERDRDFFERNDPKFDGDPRTLEWLRNHPMMGERFYEVPPTPPDPAEILTMVTAATARGDEDALTRIYDDEDRTFKRPEILKPIEAALAGIEEARAAAAQPAEGASAAAAPVPGVQGFRPPEPE